MGCIDIFDKKVISALKQCLIGLKVKEITTEYVRDDSTNEMIKVKQKINEKTIPPNADLLKLVLSHLTEDENASLNELSDAQLLQEREKLLQQLKEEDDDSSNTGSQIQMRF